MHLMKQLCTNEVLSIFLSYNSSFLNIVFCVCLVAFENPVLSWLNCLEWGEMGSSAGGVIESPLLLAFPVEKWLAPGFAGVCANYSRILVHFVSSAALKYCIIARNGEFKKMNPNKNVTFQNFSSCIVCFDSFDV